MQSRALQASPSMLTDLDSYSLYLHIPFCRTRCTYCAFNTYANAGDLIPAYVAAMCRELTWLGAGQPIHTVYFGGGTPSLLSPAQVAGLLDTVRCAFDVAPDVEITLEANPGSVDGEYLYRLRSTGVNRLSIGMQSAHAQELRLFARQHEAGAVGKTVADARRAGFDNLSLDLIYGVPNQTLTLWRESVEAALVLEPDHLSLYALALEAGTPLARQVERGDLPAPDDDLAADMYELADNRLRAAGFAQYEISNWAKPGRACRHNLQYWRNAPYLGLGAGAHGYAAGIRYEIVRPIRRYIDLAMQQESPLPFPMTPTVERWEVIDTPAAMAEHMLTGLRLIEEGVNVADFQQRFGVPIREVYGSALDWLTRHDLLRDDGDAIRLTPRARLISNRVFIQFMPG
jgi:oxygen-independent coproporphyrinogen-3 oxidase